VVDATNDIVTVLKAVEEVVELRITLGTQRPVGEV
jgi:hypothetical protein